MDSKNNNLHRTYRKYLRQKYECDSMNFDTLDCEIKQLIELFDCFDIIEKNFPYKN